MRLSLFVLSAIMLFVSMAQAAERDDDIVLDGEDAEDSEGSFYQELVRKVEEGVVRRESKHKLPSCESVRCASGTHCELTQVQCVRAPCNPIPQCVPNKPAINACATVRCASGTHCELTQVQCIRAPCNPTAKCVPNKLIAEARARADAASPAAPAAASATTPAAPAVAGHQPTMEEALADLTKFPLDQTLEWYKKACNSRPDIRTFCDPGFRRSQQDDLSALMEAKSAGIVLKLPFVPRKKGGDYDVGDPFKIEPSGLRKQLEALKAINSASDAASAAAAATAAANAAAAKAAADAKAAAEKAAAAAKAAQEKAEADAAAAKAAGDAEAAKKAAADKAAADAAAAAAKAAADKAAAEKAAADKAAADAAAAEAAKPKIKRVGKFLQAPNGRTLYFMTGESPNSVICTGPCRPFWPIAAGTWGIDPSAGCSGGAFVRPDGDVQLQCGNRPLYMFRDDTGPNQSNGASFNPDFQLA